MELNIRRCMRNGARTILSEELQIDKTTVSKLFHTAKTRYQLIPAFTRRTDEIITQYKRKYNL